MSFFAKGSFVIGDGQLTQFWEDAWLDKIPLATQYPSLYAVDMGIANRARWLSTPEAR
jgi:hypothetical protein